MKKNIETDAYRFIGDSRENLAKRVVDGRVLNYRQTDIIKALSENKQYVKSGQKLKSSINSSRQTYFFYYGEGEEVQQIIKITLDKKVLENGDPNALAIDGMCQSAIKVKTKDRAMGVLCGVTAALMLAGTFAGIMYANKLENEERKAEMDSYIQEINEQRRENGVPEISSSDYIFETDEDYHRSR